MNDSNKALSLVQQYIVNVHQFSVITELLTGNMGFSTTKPCITDCSPHSVIA